MSQYIALIGFGAHKAQIAAIRSICVEWVMYSPLQWNFASALYSSQFSRQRYLVSAVFSGLRWIKEIFKVLSAHLQYLQITKINSSTSLFLFYFFDFVTDLIINLASFWQNSVEFQRFSAYDQPIFHQFPCQRSYKLHFFCYSKLGCCTFSYKRCYLR